MNNNKEVDFYRYCPFCEHVGENETDLPCDECLQNAVNEDSHKPTHFKEKSK